MVTQVGKGVAIEGHVGLREVVGVGFGSEFAERDGPHYLDSQTEMLAALAGMYEDFQRVRIASMQRGLEGFYGDDLDRLVNRASVRLSKALRQHPVWPWLSDYPGLGGVHTARLLGMLRDPHRFPDKGRPASQGARSVWHYCGLHVVNGRLPMRRKGQRCDWNPSARTAVLMPGGIAEQIVRLRVPVYRDIYDQAKQRIATERGVVDSSEIELGVGPALAPSGVADRIEIDNLAGPGTLGSEGVVVGSAVDTKSGSLRPFQIEQRARIIAAKAFVADLWSAWKMA